MVLLLPVRKITGGDRIAPVVEDDNQTAIIFIRKWPKQDRIDHTKDCGVGSNAKRQREHRDGCEAR